MTCGRISSPDFPRCATSCAAGGIMGSAETFWRPFMRSVHAKHELWVRRSESVGSFILIFNPVHGEGVSSSSPQRRVRTRTEHRSPPPSDVNRENQGSCRLTEIWFCLDKYANKTCSSLRRHDATPPGLGMSSSCLTEPFHTAQMAPFSEAPSHQQTASALVLEPLYCLHYPPVGLLHPADCQFRSSLWRALKQLYHVCSSSHLEQEENWSQLVGCSCLKSNCFW